jgi:hypothetical protein
VRLFFTDGEERGGAEGVRDQGAFGIARRLTSLGLGQDDVYAFDCCGRGDVAVHTKAGEGGGSRDFRLRFADLYRRTETLLRQAAPESWVSLPTAYSDNAGFLACGIPAVTITVLPSGEVSRYLVELRKDKTLEGALLTGNGGLRGPLPLHGRTSPAPIKFLFPSPPSIIGGMGIKS